MRLPRGPFIYIRDSERGEVLMSSGRRFSRLKMAGAALRTAICAQVTFWPEGSVSGGPSRVTSDTLLPRPKAGAVLMVWDGSACILWTGMSDEALMQVSRFASTLMLNPDRGEN